MMEAKSFVPFAEQLTMHDKIIDKYDFRWEKLMCLSQATYLACDRLNDDVFIDVIRFHTRHVLVQNANFFLVVPASGATNRKINMLKLEPTFS